MGFIIKLIRWLFKKFAAAAVIVTLALAAGGLWLFLKDTIDFSQWRQDVVNVLNGQRSEINAALDDVQNRLNRLSAEITAEQARAAGADHVIAQLHELESTWDRLFGNPEQQKANAAQLEKMNEMRLALKTKITALRRELTRTTWEIDGLKIALGKLDAQITAAAEKKSRLMHYLETAWDYPLGRGLVQFPVKIWVGLFLGLYFTGPSLAKLILYTCVAPFITRGRPVRLAETLPAMPAVTESRVAIDLPLVSGQRLWVREKFLQASDEGVQRQTRAVLDWRIPFTCAATGLIELIELKNSSAAAQDRQVTLAHQDDPHCELAVLTLPLGAAFVLRPSFLVGVITTADARLSIRRRWQLFRWQSWVTGQFRFFEFNGPCALVIAGVRGVRAERLIDRPGDALPARRTNQDATVGFTPNLDYQPVRAETFWSYYRGMNPLFDDLFSGRGIFLTQAIATPGDTAGMRRFWSALWATAMRIFGL